MQTTKNSPAEAVESLAKRVAAQDIDALDLGQIDALRRDCARRVHELQVRMSKIKDGDIRRALDAGDGTAAARLDRERQEIEWEIRALEQQIGRLKNAAEAARCREAPAKVQGLLDRLPKLVEQAEEARRAARAAAGELNGAVNEIGQIRSRLFNSPTRNELPRPDAALAVRVLRLLGGAFAQPSSADGAIFGASRALGLPDRVARTVAGDPHGYDAAAAIAASEPETAEPATPPTHAERIAGHNRRAAAEAAAFRASDDASLPGGSRAA